MCLDPSLVYVRRVFEEKSLLRQRYAELNKKIAGMAEMNSLAGPGNWGNSGQMSLGYQQTMGKTDSRQGLNTTHQKQLIMELLHETERDNVKLKHNLSQNDHLLTQIHAQYKDRIEFLESENKKFQKSSQEIESEYLKVQTQLKEVYAEKEKYEGLYKQELASKSQLVHQHADERFKIRSQLEAVFESKLESLRSQLTQQSNSLSVKAPTSSDRVQNLVSYLTTIANLELEVESLKKQLRVQGNTLSEQSMNISRLEELLLIERDMRKLTEAQKHQSENANLELIAKVGGLVQSLPGLLSGIEGGGLLNLLDRASQAASSHRDEPKSHRTENGYR